MPRRSPCGERGLKSRTSTGYVRRDASLPVRGAWIEIGSDDAPSPKETVAPRAGSVD